MKPNVFYFDIEISPNTGRFWRNKYLGEVAIIEVLEESQILCYGYKWGDGKIGIRSQRHDPDYKVGVLSDKWLIQQLRDDLDKADIVIGQNSDKFDVKFFNSRCVMHGIKPPSAFKTYDTLKINKKHFSHLENNLKSLTKRYGITQKVEHSGFMTMLYKVMAGDWREMEKYCKGDIQATYELFNRVLEWEKIQKPTWQTKRNCPTCGSNNTQSRGQNSGGYRRFCCIDCLKADRDSYFTGEQVIPKL